MKPDVPNTVSVDGMEKVNQFFQIAPNIKILDLKWLSNKLQSVNLPVISKTPITSFPYKSEKEISAMCFTICQPGRMSNADVVNPLRDKFCLWDEQMKGKPGEKGFCPFTLTEWKRGLEAQERLNTIKCTREGTIIKSITNCQITEQMNK